MKQRNKEKRLQKKREVYDAMVSKRPELKYSMKKPGSIKKP